MCNANGEDHIERRKLVYCCHLLFLMQGLSFKHICWEIGIAEKKSVEHSFCAKQCVMLMEKITLK